MLFVLLRCSTDAHFPIARPILHTLFFVLLNARLAYRAHLYPLNFHAHVLWFGFVLFLVDFFCASFITSPSSLPPLLVTSNTPVTRQCWSVSYFCYSFSLFCFFFYCFPLSSSPLWGSSTSSSSSSSTCGLAYVCSSLLPFLLPCPRVLA